MHLGRRSVTVGRQQGRTLIALVEQALDGVDFANPEGLAERLLQASKAVEGRGHWSMVMDSCWLPVTTLSALEQAWTPAELKDVARHRWASLYGATHAPWVVQTSYLPGDASATAYGLSSRVKAQIQTFSNDVTGKVVSIQPSGLWAFENSVRQHQNGPALSGWLWLEEDRVVASTSHRGHLQVEIPALDLPESLQGLESMLAAAPAFQEVEAFFAIGLKAAWMHAMGESKTLQGKPLVSGLMMAATARGAS